MGEGGGHGGEGWSAGRESLTQQAGRQKGRRSKGRCTSMAGCCQCVRRLVHGVKAASRLNQGGGCDLWVLRSFGGRRCTARGVESAGCCATAHAPAVLPPATASSGVMPFKSCEI